MASSSHPSIAVVVPMHNRAHCVIAALDSILAQTLRPAQLIVVDNASTDNSRAVVERWMTQQKPRCELLLLSEATPGAAAARNRGLAAVTTEWVSFFDSDDWMSPHFLQNMLSCAQQQQREWVIARTQMAFAENPTQPPSQSAEDCHPVPLQNPTLVTRWGKPQPTLSDQILGACVSTQSFVAKTALVRRIGGWNPQLLVWNDYEIGLRLLLASPQPAWCNDVFHRIFQHPDSITGTDYRSRAAQITQAMVSIAQTLLTADAQLHSVDALPHSAEISRTFTALHYRTAIVVGQMLRENAPQAASTLQQTMNDVLPLSSRWVRISAHFLRHYVQWGGRGAWRIAKALTLLPY